MKNTLFRRFILHVFFIVSYGGVSAQHQEVTEKPGMWKGRQQETIDTNSLLQAFKRGSVHGHFRYYFMSTQNEPGLSDYYAHAGGGGIRYETARFHGFQFAVSGFFIFNLGSSDLGLPDPKTGQNNRYEIGLFDIEDPYNKNDIDRLEEFYIKYSKTNGSITFGRQLLNTPFINLQDGRMRPTGVEGIYGEWHQGTKIKLEGGWLYAISPRSTTKWYGVGESVGIYPSGVQENGQKSDYKNNLSSAGVFLAGAHWKPHPNWAVQVWDQWADRLMNSALVQVSYSWPISREKQLAFSVQGIRQDALKYGGNADPAKTYMQRGGKSVSVGAKAGYRSGPWDINLNYTRITRHGRYLMPREWGRDPFFTFLPRERSEGLGDLHAWMGKANWQWGKTGFKAGLAFGYFDLPSVSNTRLNKYGFPSYLQGMADIRYAFHGFLQGLEAQLLIVHKWENSTETLQPRHIFNKVNMGHFNFVLNYHF